MKEKFVLYKEKTKMNVHQVEVKGHHLLVTDALNGRVIDRVKRLLHHFQSLNITSFAVTLFGNVPQKALFVVQVKGAADIVIDQEVGKNSHPYAQDMYAGIDLATKRLFRILSERFSGHMNREPARFVDKTGETFHFFDSCFVDSTFSPQNHVEISTNFAVFQVPKSQREEMTA